MKSRLEVLDGVRGLAILMVLIFHVSEGSGVRFELPQAHPLISMQVFGTVGFMGVELFFFISGFCLFFPYARHMHEAERRPSWREYAYRRFIKIVPSYVIALTFCAIAVRAAYPTWGALSVDYLRHLFFVHTLWPDSFFTISGPFWTLGVEVQFYVLFPLLALAAMRSPILTWAGVSAIGIAYRQTLIANHTYTFTALGNQVPAMIDLFATGMLGAYLYVRWRPVFERSAVARAAATAVAAGAAVVFFAELHSLAAALDPVETTFGYYRWQAEHRSAVGLTILVLVLASAFGLTWWRWIVANPILSWLSLISYNLYLWNKTVVQSCRDHGFPCSLSPTPWLTTPDWGATFVGMSIAIAIGVAAIITYGVEQPLLKLRPAWLQRLRSGPAPSSAAVGSLR